MYLKGLLFSLITLLLISCEDSSIDIADPIIEEDSDNVSSMVFIMVIDNGVVPLQQVYVDTFEIDSTSNYIDISENIVILELDQPFSSVSNYQISIDPPVYLPKLLVYTILPLDGWWHYQWVHFGWRISTDPPTTAISAIAFFGYTTDNSDSIDTLSISLSLNNVPIFTDSIIVVNYNSLTNAVFKSIPGTDHPSESTQSIRFKDEGLGFATGFRMSGRDPRNIHHFVLYHRQQNGLGGSISSPGVIFSGVISSLDAYFFFSNLPNL